LILLCAITVGLAAPAADLRIQGSNTIGANLGPALVAAPCSPNKACMISTAWPVIPPNEHSIVGTTAQGQQVRVDVAAHGSGTGFAALNAGQADVVASSRPDQGPRAGGARTPGRPEKPRTPSK
jgi:phosphate transport system substrate-binding protein